MGDSERILGVALKDGYRERVHLVTKLPLFIVTNAGQFDKYLASQLKRLQTDHLDAYLFHAVSQGGFNKIKKLGLIRKMEAAKKEGLIGAVGFSFHDTLPVFKEVVDYYLGTLCRSSTIIWTRLFKRPLRGLHMRRVRVWQL